MLLTEEEVARKIEKAFSVADAFEEGLRPEDVESGELQVLVLLAYIKWKNSGIALQSVIDYLEEKGLIN